MVKKVATVFPVHKNGPVPQYATSGSAAVDLETTEEIIARPGEITLIPTNVVVDYPEGYAALVILRSSTPKRWGLLMPHGVGLIDRDYNGPTDTVAISVFNFRNTVTIIPPGTKLAQLLFVKSDPLEIQVSMELPTTPSRGGFGSTS